MHNLFVTYPRSGQQLIARSLIAYFDKDYNTNYCEYYSCCKNFPCAKKKEVLIHKNHDFGLELKDREDTRYAIGIRHPYDSLLSYYKLYEGHNLNKFIADKAQFWKGFVEKWILSNKSVEVFEYKQVVTDFEHQLARMITFFWPDHDIDTKKIAWIKDNITTSVARRRSKSQTHTKGVSLKIKREKYECHSQKLYDMVMKITGEAAKGIEEKLGLRL